MSSFLAGWYVIYTKPRHEKKVHGGLIEMNIECFLPTRKILRTWHDRKKFVDEPLFPSYLFIYIKDMKTYYDGLNTEGVLNYVRTGKKIARVSESVIESIKLLTSKDTDLEISDRYFQPGDKLVINKGPLTGLACEVVKFNSKEKLLVRVDLLQRNILVTLAQENLMAI
jgi:transcription antitermination factor NusG